MPFLAIAIVFAVLELWSMISSFGEVPLPPILRVLVPAAVAISSVRSQGRERMGLLVTSALLLVVLNRSLVNADAVVSLIVLLLAGVLAWVDIRGRPVNRRIRTGHLIAAASAVILVYLVSLLFL